MQAKVKYDPTLPRSIADLIHRYGLKIVLSEVASYCQVEWIQAAQRSEPAEQWRNASEALSKVIKGLEAEE